MKKFFVVLVLVFGLFVFAGCSSQNVISKDDAIAKAISHSGVSKEDVTFSKAELDRDDGMSVYEIEFYANGSEFDYEINAETGEIIKFSSEPESGSKKQDSQDNTAPTEFENLGITMEQAIGIALEQVPGATRDNVRAKEDFDDGKLQYDVTVIYNEVKYEFEIDAQDGRITETDRDSVYDD